MDSATTIAFLMSTRANGHEVDHRTRAFIDAAFAIRELYRSTAPFEVTEAHTRRFQAAYPFATYALNQNVIAARLVGDGQQYFAQVNVRVAFEHALVAQWVMLTEGAEDQLLATLYPSEKELPHSRSNGNHRRSEPQAPLAAPSTPGIPSIEKLCDRFDTTDQIRSLYRELTAAVQPSLSVLAAHVTVLADGTVGLRRQSQPPRTEWAMALAWSAVLAADVLESLRTGQPHITRVRMIAQRCGLASDLRKADRFAYRQPVQGRAVSLDNATR